MAKVICSPFLGTRSAGQSSGHKLSFPAGTLKIESTWGVCDN